jgi:hypothetical protein
MPTGSDAFASGKPQELNSKSFGNALHRSFDEVQ